ncbi:MAG: glycosyltransferase family 2 protein [Candidatus Levybacteria bacterium]|nr:glycosyltransferase family 2 protein [Candidatus Levybacteria bacterium]
MTNKLMKKVFVIILTWNRRELVVNCLESLKKIKTSHDIQVIVVDNASIDDTIPYLKKFYPEIKVIKNLRNLGWSGGNNIGIKYAIKNKADFIILLNNDIIVEKNCIDRLILGLEKNKPAGIASPKIYRYNTKPPIISNAGNFFNSHYYSHAKGAGEVDKGQCNKIAYTDFVAGVVCARSEVYKKCGLLDEDYFLYFEDADFCVRARKKGYLSVFIQDAVLYHMESATIGMNSPSHTYYNSRNHLLFIKKHGTFKLLIRELYLAVRLSAKKILRGSSDGKYFGLGVIDFILCRFGYRKYWK